MIVRSLSDGFSSVVRTSHGLTSLVLEVVVLLRHSGVLLFQETHFDLRQFEVFSDRLAPQHGEHIQACTGEARGHRRERWPSAPLRVLLGTLYLTRSCLVLL